MAYRSPNTPMQSAVGKFLIYEETPDQAQTIADVKRDMETNAPWIDW